MTQFKIIFSHAQALQVIIFRLMVDKLERDDKCFKKTEKSKI